VQIKSGNTENERLRREVAALKAKLGGDREGSVTRATLAAAVWQRDCPNRRRQRLEGWHVAMWAITSTISSVFKEFTSDA
jgi:hypothetical protein